MLLSDAARPSAPDVQQAAFSAVAQKENTLFKGKNRRTEALASSPYSSSAASTLEDDRAFIPIPSSGKDLFSKLAAV